MLQATAHLLRLLAGQLRHRFVLHLVVGDALGTVEVSEVASCPADAHPLLHAAESVEAHRSSAGGAVGGVERSIRGVLMVAHTVLATLGWTGSSNEIAQLLR